MSYRYTFPFSVTPPASAADITAFTILAAGETIIVEEVILTDELAASDDRAARFQMKRADSISAAGTEGSTPTPLPNRVGYPAFVGTVKTNYSAEPTLHAGSLAVAHERIPFATGASFPLSLNSGEGVRVVGTKVVQGLISCAAGTRANPISGLVTVRIA